MLPVEDAGEYPDDVFVMTTDEVTGRKERVMHRQGSFVFRLSGRDRQRSASYYTPEVLTRCVVKHALAELLGLDDYAPENGSSGITNAVEMLDLTICEPALGSGAFANEAINQLSAEYLRRREAELGEVLNPAQRDIELQKVKAHFALHQTYGVDLNATAVELAEVSLWLNAMYPGLKAPWFGLQLRQGNSLIGCRRATWTTSQLGDRPWANTKSGSVQPPVDRPLTEPLKADEIHHFLLPGHGWAAVADRKEAKELRPDEVESLKAWRKQVLKAPTKAEAKRLTALAAGVETMWASAAERIRLTKRALRRNIDIYGAPSEKPGTSISRAEATKALNDPDSALGRLRTLMDAWAGLWFWPLDTGVRPPSWGEWLAVAEDLIRPDERHGLTGQLDLFDDLGALLDAERVRQQGQLTMQQLRDGHPWLSIAVDAARREGAWHWELEFAPEFQRGGFDLQVGNPPWVRPVWHEDLVLAESDPWWALADKPSESAMRQRRGETLGQSSSQDSYLGEVASAEGLVESLRSPLLFPTLAGVQTNLYLNFLDTAWRRMKATGSTGFVHPDGHLSDPKAGAMRRVTYRRARRLWGFVNERKLFEDIGNVNPFTLSVYASERPVSFLQASHLLETSTLDASLVHDGSGAVPGIKTALGDWDVRPHRSRILVITEPELGRWAQLFDEPGTPAVEARLLRPLTMADLDGVSTIAKQTSRLSDRDYHWSSEWHEKGAKTDGTIRWTSSTPASWDEVILQGPHFTVANPSFQLPNEPCRNHRDWAGIELEALPERAIPRTNYSRACDPETFASRLSTWNGSPFRERWRHIHRAMTQPGTERSVQGALIPPGPTHVHACLTYGFEDLSDLVLWAGLLASIPIDFLFKVSGAAGVADHQLRRVPMPVSHPLASAVELRTLRLNCLTVDYAPLWADRHDPRWQADRWSDESLREPGLGDDFGHLVKKYSASS